MQNTKKLKLGFIGGGVNSAVGYTHIVASQMDNRFEIVYKPESTLAVDNNISKNKETLIYR